MAASDEAALHAEILAQPEADEPRRKLGQLLQQRGDARGELIAVQLRIAELHRSQGPVSELAGLTPRERALLENHATEWARGLPGQPTDYIFRRGFPEGVKIDAGAFPRAAAALYAKAPILHLELKATAAQMAALAASSALDRIVSINLWRQPIGDDGASELASSTHLGRLAWLELSKTGAGRPALNALCETSNLPRLTWLGFTGNAVPNPSDRPAGIDNDAIMDWEPSPLGEELEKKHGPKRWLHFRADVTTFYPPLAFALVVR